MNYREIIMFEKAVTEFVKKQKRQPVIIAKYYEVQGKNGKYDYAFIGHKTEKEGRFGIHFRKQGQLYSFGTKIKGGKSAIWTLTESQIRKLSTRLKEAFMEAVEYKMNMSFNVENAMKNDLNEWI